MKLGSLELMPLTIGGLEYVAYSEEFLEGRIGFRAIAATVAETLDRLPGGPAASVEEILAIDGEARRLARDIAAERAVRVSG